MEPGNAPASQALTTRLHVGSVAKADLKGSSLEIQLWLSQATVASRRAYMLVTNMARQLPGQTGPASKMWRSIGKGKCRCSRRRPGGRRNTAPTTWVPRFLDMGHIFLARNQATWSGCVQRGHPNPTGDPKECLAEAEGLRNRSTARAFTRARASRSSWAT